MMFGACDEFASHFLSNYRGYSCRKAHTLTYTTHNRERTHRRHSSSSSLESGDSHAFTGIRVSHIKCKCDASNANSRDNAELLKSIRYRGVVLLEYKEVKPTTTRCDRSGSFIVKGRPCTTPQHRAHFGYS
ncbi:hypothetical protein GOP47_0011403 [Adiantum capillus-veneris]|uniref:Uncharacterized protein n=1 Tax=Adiantum capillus-veneris TaxID=13818 RepID=A0A9D4ZHL8_ADICA|nr:hypothetical protein GOP47_0011403 [Adiantum capillus-veneris]